MSETSQSPVKAGGGGELCTSCGLCCTGAIHDYVHLQSDEVGFAREVGLPVRQGEPPSFTLPCPKLVTRKCGIFPSRPRVCGEYRCQLLIDKEAGSIDLPDALQIVARAHELLRSAEVAIGDGTVSEARRSVQHEAGIATSDQEEPQAAKEKRVRERLSVLALDVFLDRHFRNKRDGRMYVAAD